jgi:CubicO group peptidase (beta-lactamase class C family)
MQNGGNWNGNQLMTDANYFQEMITPSQNLNNSYGYLWWLNGQSSYMIPQAQIVIPGMMFPNAPADVYAAMGRDGQFLNVSPSEGLVFVRMGNAPDNSLVPFLLNDQIWEKLNAVLCTSVTESNDNNFMLNQTASSVRISWPGKTFTCEIFDIKGNKISSSEARNSKEMNTTALSAGVYVVRCASGSAVEVRKVVVR